MPELPEVETVVRQLRPHLLGLRAKKVSILDEKLRPSGAERLLTHRVVDVQRRGKQIVISARHGRQQLNLSIHLRMTGRLIVEDSNLPLDRRGLRARIDFNQKRSLYFFDVRRFGTFEVFSGSVLPPTTGIDPLSATCTLEHFRSLLATSSQPMKLWLLRQDRILGIGNIYASEILYDARVSPQRAACSLSALEQRKIFMAMKKILSKAIEYCGTTFSDFQDANGEIGSYQRYLRVYNRDGEPCRRCKKPIQRIVQGQRSTFYCAGCQQ